MKTFVSTVIAAATLTLSFATQASAVVPDSTKGVKVIGARIVGGVYVIKAGDAVTLQFPKGSWTMVDGKSWVPVSATTNSLQMTYNQIPLDSLVNPYLFCTGSIGATNPKAPEVLVATTTPTPAVTRGEHGFITGQGLIDDNINDSNIHEALGWATWLSPNASGRVTLTFDLDQQPGTGPIDFNLSLATRTAHVFKFYLTKEAIKNGIPLDGGFMRPRYIEAKHGGRFDDLLDSCVQPNAFLKFRIER